MPYANYCSVEGLIGLDWKRLLRLNQDEVLGLDIGSSVVKIIQLRKDDAGYAVTAAGIADIAASGEDDNRTEIDTVRAIRECFESTGIQTRMAVCSVCGPEVAVRYFKFPSLPPEEMEGAMLLEASQVCPFNVDDGSIDYQLIPNGENDVSGVLVAATTKLVKRKSQFAKSASLNNVLMDVDGLALLNCFRAYERLEAGRAAAILNVGSSYTNLAIMSDNNLPFIRDMAYAGDDITEQIASERNVSTETVRKLLSRRPDSRRETRGQAGCENPTEAEPELGESLARACQKLIVDVTETLRYYEAQEKSAIVEKIFVCGGFALVKGFVELLDNQLPVKASVWNPFEKIRCEAGGHCEDILAKKGPAMAVAAGLAMRSI